MTTTMIMAEPGLRPQAAAWLDAFGASRRVAFGDMTAPPAQASAPGACCAGG
jgi:hypothetical protein